MNHFHSKNEAIVELIERALELSDAWLAMNSEDRMCVYDANNILGELLFSLLTPAEYLDSCYAEERS